MGRPVDDFEAFVVRDWAQWLGGPLGPTVTLHVGRREGSRRVYLKRDGLWVSVDEAVSPPEDIGLKLPADAIEAIARGIADFQGHASHADTEARVLREWLAVERDRVDKALGA